MITNLNIKYIIIIIIIIISIIIYFYKPELLKNTTYFDNDSNYEYIMTLDKNDKNDKEINDNNNEVLLIGNDNNQNLIFKYKNRLYNIENDKLYLSTNKYNEKDLTYYEVPKKVLIDFNSMALKFKLKFNNYNFVGLVSNKYYHLEYILYEKLYDLDNELEDKLYYYILVKIIDNIYTIIYELPPRNKISFNEYIWVKYGPFQVGPLLFKICL
jgi:hypothetical protein